MLVCSKTSAYLIIFKEISGTKNEIYSGKIVQNSFRLALFLEQTPIIFRTL